MSEQVSNLEQSPTLESDAETVNPEEELQKAIQENQELQQQLMRSLADFQNFRRRTQQEKEELRKFATEQLVCELLPVLDAFEKTLQAIEAGAEINSIKDGIRMTDRMLKQTLETVQLKRMNVLGQTFDPNLHEALATENSDQYPDQHILEEISSGYTLQEKVLRPAKVKVVRNS